jgi:hypothetical protein
MIPHSNGTWVNRVIEKILENGPYVVRSTTEFQKHDAEGALHCDDGPAMRTINGDEYWFKHGKLHRIDGPARVWKDGSKEWWVHGKVHRTDGPAVCGPWGPSQWFVGGRRFTEHEFDLYVDTTTGEAFVPPGKKLTYDKK